MKVFNFNNVKYYCEVVKKYTNSQVTTIRVITGDGERNVYTWGNGYKEPLPCKENKITLDVNVVKKAYSILNVKIDIAIINQPKAATGSATNNMMYRVTVSDTGSIAIFNNKIDAFDFAIGKSVVIDEVSISINKENVTEEPCCDIEIMEEAEEPKPTRANKRITPNDNKVAEEDYVVIEDLE